MNGAQNTYNLPKVRGEYKFSEPLKDYTWLNVGGPADVMFFPADEADLCDFLKQKDKNMPLFVLGGGSNLLVRDGGLPGVVVKLKSTEFTKWRIADNILYCGAGCLNFNLKKTIAEKGLGGLEFLCSIPGTVGGAVRGNAGCFGADIAKVLTSIRVMKADGTVRTLSNEDCGFAYRHSNLGNDEIILEAGLQFIYKEPAEVAETIAQNAEYRRTHQPQGIKTAGSTFKNPEGLAAWKLIKDAGGDTMVCGGAKMSAQHCNFLQNDGNSAADIEKLCLEITDAVKQKCGVTLEREVKIVGRR